MHSGRQCCLKEPRSERKTTPARGSGTPDETFPTPARHGSGHHEIFIAHTHPKCPISDHFQRAGAKFLSHRHPNDHTVLRRGDISFMQPPGSTPREHPPRGRHRRNRAHLETQSPAAVLVGDGGARPDNEPTHRAHISDKAPLVWRAPEGPEGTGGLRDRPLRAAGSRVAISRAAGPEGTRHSGTTPQPRAAANKRSAAGPGGTRHSGSTHRHVRVP